MVFFRLSAIPRKLSDLWGSLKGPSTFVGLFARQVDQTSAVSSTNCTGRGDQLRSGELQALPLEPG